MNAIQERNLLRAKLAALRQILPYPELLAANCRDVAHLIATSEGPCCGISKAGHVNLLVNLAEKLEAVRDIITPPENITRATPPTTNKNSQ